MDAVHVHMTNTSNLPAEALENEYPLLVDEYALVEDSGGAGNTRGGLGIARQIRAIVPGTIFSVRSDSHTVGVPSGVFGGLDGRRAKLIRNPGRPGRRSAVFQSRAPGNESRRRDAYRNAGRRRLWPAGRASAMTLWSDGLLEPCVALVIAAVCGYAAAAESYPARPVRVIVGFPPGGFVDFTARLVATPLGAALGQPFVVENRGGAGGIVGTEVAARAAPDGYTLTVGSAGTHGVNQSLYPKLPYNVLRDFQPIARLADAPSILAVHPSLPVRSVKELIALARAKPGQIMYASAGSGTSTHLAAVLFEHLARVKLVHVPFKGGGPAIVALVAGEVPVTFGTAASVSPQTKSGRLRGLAVTSGQRSAVLPDLPTIAESGLPGYEMLNWLGCSRPPARRAPSSTDLQRVAAHRAPPGNRLAVQRAGRRALTSGNGRVRAFVKTRSGEMGEGRCGDRHDRRMTTRQEKRGGAAHRGSFSRRVSPLLPPWSPLAKKEGGFGSGLARPRPPPQIFLCGPQLREPLFLPF